MRIFGSIFLGDIFLLEVTLRRRCFETWIRVIHLNKILHKTLTMLLRQILVRTCSNLGVITATVLLSNVLKSMLSIVDRSNPACWSLWLIKISDPISWRRRGLGNLIHLYSLSVLSDSFILFWMSVKRSSIYRRWEGWYFMTLIYLHIYFSSSFRN